MKIFVTGLRGIPHVMGGVESHCEELLPRVNALDPDFEITVLARKRYVPQTVRCYRGVSIRSFPCPRLPSLEAIVATATGVLYAGLKRADLLHIHAIGPGLMTPVARLLGLRVVVTHHSRNYEHGKWGRFARLMLWMGERASIRFAHKVIVVGPWLFKTLADAYPRQAHKFIFIPNGVPDLGNDAAVDEGGEQLEPGYILAVGRIVPEKGFHYLIDAMLATGGDRKLVIVGDADHATPYARQLVAASSERIIFVGRQSRSSLKRIYRNAALFVLPSLHEGLPISPLEAASCGTPILLSDIGPNRDIGLADHHYFRVGNVDELAKRLSEPPQNFAVDADEIQSRFDWDRIAYATKQIYLDAAGR